MPTSGTTPTGVPKPDRVLPYRGCGGSTSTSTSVLYLFGDSSSSKMVLLCAGFADDHTVFQPFANTLTAPATIDHEDSGDSGSSGSGIFAGVMCLPGFDDRPEEGAPWHNHKRDGYTFDEWVLEVRAAAKALWNASTYSPSSSVTKPEFIGIFHDWGALAGCLWASRLEEEANDYDHDHEHNNDPNSTTRDFVKPDKMVFFDVLCSPPPLKVRANNEDDDNDNNKRHSNQPQQDYDSEHKRGNFIQTYTTKQLFFKFFYFHLFAFGFAFQRHISRTLAPFVVLPSLIFWLVVLQLGPLYDFDNVQALYEDAPGPRRVLYMAYPYWNAVKLLWNFSRHNDKGGGPFASTHHSDWKATPILYLYGKTKKTMWHDFDTLALLEREEAEHRSLSKAVGLEGAGHFFYVPAQKQDETLRHVLDFIWAENTFLSR